MNQSKLFLGYYGLPQPTPADLQPVGPHGWFLMAVYSPGLRHQLVNRLLREPALLTHADSNPGNDKNLKELHYGDPVMGVRFLSSRIASNHHT